MRPDLLGSELSGGHVSGIILYCLRALARFKTSRPAMMCVRIIASAHLADLDQSRLHQSHARHQVAIAYLLTDEIISVIGSCAHHMSLFVRKSGQGPHHVCIQ